MRRNWQGNRENSVTVMAQQARNDFGEVEYNEQDFDRETKGHVLDSTTLMGKFATELAKQRIHCPSMATGERETGRLLPSKQHGN